MFQMIISAYVFGEAIKLYNSAIAMGDLIFRYLHCYKNEAMSKNDELRNLMLFGIGVYGRVIEKFYCVTPCVT